MQDRSATEVIKVTEAPSASPKYLLCPLLQDMASLKRSGPETIERGTLMLVWMASPCPMHGRIGRSWHLGGIRGWLQSIRTFVTRRPTE